MFQVPPLYVLHKLCAIFNFSGQMCNKREHLRDVKVYNIKV